MLPIERRKMQGMTDYLITSKAQSILNKDKCKKPSLINKDDAVWLISNKVSPHPTAE